MLFEDMRNAMAICTYAVLVATHIQVRYRTAANHIVPPLTHSLTWD